MMFEGKTAPDCNSWLQAPPGSYLDERKKNLILRLAAPERGERLLDIGCGTGEYLALFQNSGCDVTGIDSSAELLALARQKLGQKVELLPGQAEDLPFNDNEFDIVSLIFPLEFTADPEKALAEAIRVSQGRVVIGVHNKFSAAMLQRQICCLFSPSFDKMARFYQILELKRLIRSFLPGVDIRWGSVIFLPVRWYGFAVPLEEALLVMNNPFGAFLGLSFPVNFNLRTVQDIIGDPFKMKADERQPAQGIVREGILEQKSHFL